MIAGSTRVTKHGSTLTLKLPEVPSPSGLSVLTASHILISSELALIHSAQPTMLHPDHTRRHQAHLHRVTITPPRRKSANKPTNHRTPITIRTARLIPVKAVEDTTRTRLHLSKARKAVSVDS